jgi:hypothetical protein
MLVERAVGTITSDVRVSCRRRCTGVGTLTRCARKGCALRSRLLVSLLSSQAIWHYVDVPRRESLAEP